MGLMDGQILNHGMRLWGLKTISTLWNKCSFIINLLLKRLSSLSLLWLHNSVLSIINTLLRYGMIVIIMNQSQAHYY